MTYLFFHLLTLVFVFAKLFGHIDWSWWLVLAPTLFVVGLTVLILVFTFGVLLWAASTGNIEKR